MQEESRERVSQVERQRSAGACGRRGVRIHRPRAYMALKFWPSRSKGKRVVGSPGKESEEERYACCTEWSLLATVYYSTGRGTVHV